MVIMIYVATLYAAEDDIVKVRSILKTISVTMAYNPTASTITQGEEY